MSRTFIAVLIMAVVTYIPRVFPLAVSKNRLKSRFLRSFLYYVPYAVLGAMTFPGILSSSSNIYSSAAGMGVAIVLAYFEKGLMKVAIGAIITVYVIEMLFNL